jgi:hypothetical protein
MKMKRSIVLSTLVLAVSVAFVSGAMAQQKPAQPAPAERAKLEKFSGVIEKVDPVGKDVLMQAEKEKMTFSLGEQTKIMEGTRAVPLTGLKKGMWASVEYKKEGSKLVAESVSLGKPGPAAKKETPSEVKTGTPAEKQSVEKK